jgi:hypothetical protein
MKSCAWTAVAVAVFAGSASAQSGGFRDVPSGHWAAGALEGLSTRAIVAPAKAGGAFDGSKPVTRYELAVTLWKLVQYMERADKQKKSKDGASAPIDGPGAVKRLVADGYLPANSPIVTEGSKSVTADQLATALVQVIARSKEKTVPVTPDSKKSLPIDRPGSSGS